MHTFMHIYIYNIHRVQLYASNSYTQSHAHTYTLTHMHIIHILTYTCTQAHTELLQTQCINYKLYIYTPYTSIYLHNTITHIYACNTHTYMHMQYTIHRYTQYTHT